MIDREARNEVIQGIDEFMDDQCDSSDLDGLLDMVYFETQDETIRNLRFVVMQTYDFLWPHMIDVDLLKWKFLNRVRLLLQSDAELTVTRQRRWTVRQTAALLSLVGYPFLFVMSLKLFGFAFGAHFALLFSTLCILTFVFLRNRIPKPLDIRLNPFSNDREILAIRKTISTFVKKPYPEEIANRWHSEPYYESEIRTKLMTVFEWIFIPSLLLSPILPEVHEKREIKLPMTNE